jgi:hypothetical protein
VDGAELIDVAPSALYLLGQPVPDSMDGVVLVDALDPAFVRETPIRRGPASELPSAASGGDSAALDGGAMTPDEEAEIQARLRGLGYL